MPTYSETDIERIAAAINHVPADVAAHAKGLEAAACWFRVQGQPGASRPPTRTPSQLKAQLRQISRSAQRLLKHLGVPTDESKRVRIKEAYDGPGDFEALRALSWAVNHDENPVVVATRRIGRLAEILEAVEAASNLEQWAEQSAEEVVEFGSATVPKGHSGDAALNDWIAAMLTIYKQITGKEPATSVGAPERDNEGVPGGPLLRFLEAAGKPLGIELTPEAWRSRVRRLLNLDEN